jgi:hypothetical protein
MSSIIIKTAKKYAGRTHRGRSGGKAFTRRPSREKANSGGFTHRTGFLKQRLKIVPVKPDTYAAFFKEHLTEENFSYLAECAVHYAGLLGQAIEIPTGSVHDKISILYHRFAEILPKGQGLNFEIANNRLTFLIHYVHQWERFTFYWMPVGFINKFSGMFREIALSFMHLFIHRNNLMRFNNQYEYDFMFEFLIENIQHDGYEDFEKEELDGVITSYQKGEISALLNEVYDCKPLHIAEALEQYQPTCPKEEKLLEGFRKGLPFLSEDCIMNYDYDYVCDDILEENEDYPPVALDRMIRYVHTLNDLICNELVSTVNGNFQETYAVEPTSYMFLKPNSTLFNPGDYPERFSQWFLEIIDTILEISDHGSTKLTNHE